MTAISENEENPGLVDLPDYIDIVDKMESPRIIKTHLSFEMLPGNNLIKLFFWHYLFFGALAFSIETFSITTLRIMAFSIMDLIETFILIYLIDTLSKEEIQHNGLNCDTHYRRQSA
jgi:hypothetical protein